jgi:O-antigen/teichoic acid export membrane protein
VNKRELVAALASSARCWAVIGLHRGRYAAFAVNLGALSISWGYLLARRSELLKLAWRGWFGEERAIRKAPGGLSWWGEIWPMQWRIAISSGASYFIFQLFNPILFQYHGSVVAGQMGMTLTAANALLGGSTTVFNAKIPELGKLVAVRDWKRLDSVFFDATKRALMLALIGAAIGTFAIWALQIYSTIGKRFIPASLAALLFLTVSFQVMVLSLAAYLRAHKKEPLMKMSVVVSLLQAAVTWYCGKNFAALGVTAGFLIINAFVLFPYCFIIWRQCRKDWHV